MKTIVLVALTAYSLGCSSSERKSGTSIAEAPSDHDAGQAPDSTTGATGASDKGGDAGFGTDAGPLGTPSTKHSCNGSAGADTHCGINQNENCCDAPRVPGGSYLRYNDAKLPSTVSAFYLDRFEITVGRMRVFLQSKASPTGQLQGRYGLLGGEGAHPKIAASGFRSSFAARLPESMQSANERFTTGCTLGGDKTDWGAPTWTESPGANEDKPLNCVDWYTLFAFCAWDGGRLPTDAEWGFASMGGDEQRVWSWGNLLPEYPAANAWLAAGLRDPADSLLKFTVGTPFGTASDGAAHIARVGEKTGRGKWGHADMMGNVIEMLLDNGALAPTPGDCVDCANVAWPDPPQFAGNPGSWRVYDPNQFNGAAQPDGGRLMRGGSWHPEHPASNLYNNGDYPVWRTYFAAGGRCARDTIDSAAATP
jgi:formylglycine-generating enzyme required for sulfatase activity